MVKKKKQGKKYSASIRWIVVVILILAIQLLALKPEWIENIYSSGIYKGIGFILRFFTGWIPFSLGDIVYASLFIYLLFLLVRFIVSIFKKSKRKPLGPALLNGLWWICSLYILFSLIWGLNYNRLGIRYQLGLQNLEYDSSDILAVQSILIQKVNASKTLILQKKLTYPSSDEIFFEAKKSYERAKDSFPFLAYHISSIKPSIFSWFGNYLNIGGYYNPFTGEAQVNTMGPPYLLPYIVTHEVAHQIGYARENEANFVGYLAAVHSENELFQYGTYLNLYFYANNELSFYDSSAAQNTVQLLLPEVQKDIVEMREFSIQHQSVLEPITTWIYSKFLMLNRQPKGVKTYNEVVGMLISYYKKYGKI